MLDGFTHDAIDFAFEPLRLSHQFGKKQYDYNMIMT